MELTASLRDGCSSHIITIDVPIISNPFIPVPMVDSRWARPYVFRNVSQYPLSEASDVLTDFRKIVDFVNNSSYSVKIDRYRDGLLKIVDEHIDRCGRILFCDLLMYVDCLSYLCYASDLMTEEQIIDNYASWAKFVVNKRRSSVLSSTRWGITNFSGSDNEEDLNSCL